MALVSMRQLLDHAAENNYGIPAFNVNNLEQVQAVMAAADEVGAPVILQASAGARKYAGESFIKHLIQAAVEMYPHIPLVHHQGDVGVHFDSGRNQVLDESLAGVLAGACAGLQDHGRTHFIGSLHHGLNLLQVVHVESRNAVIVFSGVIQQLTHRNECHETPR